MEAELKQVMDEVGWWIDVSAPVQSLSLSERQMVEILRAFHQRADLIVLDDRFALTDRETQALFTIIRRLKSQGSAFLLVSHRLDEVFSIADYITVLRDGTATVPTSQLTLREAVVMMVGENQANEEGRRERSAFPDDLPALQVRNLRATTFHDVSFDAAKGEILASPDWKGGRFRSFLLFCLAWKNPRWRNPVIWHSLYAQASPRRDRAGHRVYPGGSARGRFAHGIDPWAKTLWWSFWIRLCPGSGLSPISASQQQKHSHIYQRSASERHRYQRQLCNSAAVISKRLCYPNGLPVHPAS